MSATAPRSGLMLAQLHGLQDSLSRIIPFLCDISFLLVTISIYRIECSVAMIK